MNQISVASTDDNYCRDLDNDDGNSRPLTPPMPEAGKLWIHCNNCFAQYAVNKIMAGHREGLSNRDTRCKFFLLACKHVTCDKCVATRSGRTPNDAPIFVCRICSKTVRGRQMDNSLVSHLKEFFHPEPWILCSDEITSFQAKNMNHFNKYKARLEAEIIKDENDRDFARKICQRHYLTNRLLVVERRKVWQRFLRIKMDLRIKSEQRARERCMSKSPQCSKADADSGSSKRSPGTRLGWRSHSPHSSQLINSVTAILEKEKRELGKSVPQTPVRRRSITSFSNPSNISFDFDGGYINSASSGQHHLVFRFCYQTLLPEFERQNNPDLEKK